MAIDKAIDSAQLDADLTSVANAIRTKGGTSAALAFPAGFVSAVEAIETGGSINYLDHCTKIVFGKDFPSATPNITLRKVTDAQDMFAFGGATAPYTSVTVTFEAKPTTLARMLSSYSLTTELTSVTINGDLSRVTNYSDMVKANCGLQRLDGTPLNFSSVTNANFSIWSGNASRVLTSLSYVRYAENTLKVNHSVFCSALSDESLVSIANGLQAGAHTLTLQQEAKDRLSAIVGTVSNNGTYDVFAKDGGGTTLLSFVTTTKGWTIA